MILNHIKFNEEIEGAINIGGDLSSPYLEVVDSQGNKKLGTYPERFNLGNYQLMETNKMLDLSTMQKIIDNSFIGTSRFKISEVTKLSISPLGNKRYKGLTDEYQEDLFPEENEISEQSLVLVKDWITNQGWTDFNITNLEDTVTVDTVMTDEVLQSEFTYNTNLITPVINGGVNHYSVSREVLNFWLKINNDRYMKVIPTNSSLGNHVIITQYQELIGEDTENVSLYKEVKVRVKYNYFDSLGTSLGEDFISTHNFHFDYSNNTKLMVSENKDKTVQVILNNLALNGESPILVAKVVFDSTSVANAFITNVSIYDNNLIV